MVSFQCEGCGDIVKKPKCKIHQQRCHAPFTCIDCHQTFTGTSYQPHNQCMTESQKYEKGYKPPTKNNKPAAKPDSIISQLAKKKEEPAKRPLEEETSEPVKAKKAKKDKKDKKKTSLTEWSSDELDSNTTQQIVLAVDHVLKKDQTAHSLETLREKVVALISAHPKANAGADLKALFDQTIGLSFNTKKNKIVFGWIKK
ncbi:hypothetical protein [Absidia glauca]|uniref:Zinc finger C2H2 LYAR-type domain-containing protein n=1 Tax=Absidia glauca TaxID=4829 RepID=A0A163K6I5_ABSGL|nr:hypothetical protein [Absidia glauca]